jgi:nucleoside phosphorylase
LVSWGCAGALSGGLSPGALILPSQICQADGATESLASPWRDRLANFLRPHVPLTEGILAESPGIVASVAEKRRLHAATGALATDMETGAVFRAAARFDLPIIAVRAIADTATTAIPGAAEAALNADGELVLHDLLRQLAKHPSDLVPLIRLFHCFRAAIQTLRQVAKLAGPGLDP